MADDEERDVVYVERLPARGFAMLSGGLGGGLALIGTAYGVLGAIGDSTAFIAAALFGAAGLATGVFGLLHAVQRNYVTIHALRVELGLGEISVPLEAIESVRLEEDTRGLRRRLYHERAKKIALVSSGKLVRVEWREDGETRVLYTGSRYPEQLRDAIVAAMTHAKKRKGAPAKVRVAVDEEREVETVEVTKAERAQKRRV